MVLKGEQRVCDDGSVLQGAEIFVVCVSWHVWKCLSCPTFLLLWQIYNCLLTALLLHECGKEREPNGV